jgi:hypothetical protein
MTKAVELRVDITVAGHVMRTIYSRTNNPII